MTHPAIPTLAALVAYAALPLIQCASTPAAAAPLDGCATPRQAALHEGAPQGGAGFEAVRPDVLLANQPDTVPHAPRLQATSQGGRLSTATLEQASTAAAAALLIAVTGRRDDACPDATLRQAMAPLAQALGHDGRAEFTWSDVAIRSGTSRLGARRLSLRLDGAGPALHLDAVLDGAVSNAPVAGVLPESLSVRASLPTDQLPALLSAAGDHHALLDLTIEHAEAHRGDGTMSGTGQVSFAADAADSHGQGHLTAHDFDSLLEDASAPGLDRLRTGLFLAKLVAHRQGDQADWDLDWRQGVLTINNVPLPLR